MMLWYSCRILRPSNGKIYAVFCLFLHSHNMKLPRHDKSTRMKSRITTASCLYRPVQRLEVFMAFSLGT